MEDIDLAREALRQADCLLIGGGAGLSAAAGLTYDGRRFADNFAPFIEKYGMTDMYSAGFYPFGSEEERWAYWARHILVNRWEPPAAPLYRRLLRLTEGKDWFVITTNVDAQFCKAGFPAEQVFAVQGDYGQMQCAHGCHDTLYGNEELVRAMAAETADCRVPAHLVPHCPMCGGPMAVHLRVDGHFVQDGDWYAAQARYEAFVRAAAGRRLALLELGVGYNTPGIIRFPFERLTARHPQAVLLRLNRDDPEVPDTLAPRALAFARDMEEVLDAL